MPCIVRCTASCTVILILLVVTDSYHIKVVTRLLLYLFVLLISSSLKKSPTHQAPMTMTTLNFTDHRNVRHFKKAAIDVRDIITKIHGSYRGHSEAAEDLEQLNCYLQTASLSALESDGVEDIQEHIQSGINDKGDRDDLLGILDELLLELDDIVSCAKLPIK